MLNKDELKLVFERSKIWTGPNTWGWVEGERLNIQEAIKHPGYG